MAISRFKAKYDPQVHINPTLLTPYIDYPKEFVEDLILRYYPISPVPKLNRHQIDLFKAVVQNDWLSVRSGRGRGKTAGVALLIPWYLITRPMARVVATAPKIDLLHDVLWSEINKWLQFSPLKEMLKWSKEKVEHSHAPNVWYAVARTAKSKENLSGYHSPYQMIIGEEASGIIDEILETAEQTQLNNIEKKEIKTILISNPTKVTGYFYKTQMLKEWQKFWHPLHFKPTDEEVAVDVGAQRIISLYGIDHDITRVSVFGEFPAGNPMAVISYEKAWDAMNREVTPEGVIEIGVDVARMGDDRTVFFYRYGYKVFEPLVYKKQDTVDTEAKLLILVRELREKFKYDKVIKIKIDDSSMGGGVSDHLARNTTDGIEVVKCLFGAVGDEFYGNAASVMWAELASIIDKLEIPRSDELLEELCGRNWDTSLDNRSRQRVESKDDFKKRIKRSPDLADALVMCVSNSQEKDKILPKLISLRDDVFQMVGVRFDHKLFNRIELFGSVWCEKNIKHSCLTAAWDKETGHLTVFFEGISRMEGPDSIVSGLTNVCDMYNEQYHTTIKPRNFVFYGNRAMFGLQEGATELFSMKDGPYLSWQNKYFISILPNFMFDLNGSILKLNEMIDEHRITILNDLPLLRLQLETWVIDNERPDTENHALCMALCNIISMLMQTKRMKKKPQSLIPYGVTISKNGELIQKGSKEVFLNKMEKIFAEGFKSRIQNFLPSMFERPRVIPASMVHDKIGRDSK